MTDRHKTLALMELLEDIDRADAMCGPDDEAFRNFARDILKKRHSVAAPKMPSTSCILGGYGVPACDRGI